MNHKSLRKKISNAILYLSDLYVVVMVISWILGIILTSICAVYDLVVNQGTSIFSELTMLIGLPTTAGGAIWLIRCCIQHNKGVNPDFPNYDDNETTTNSGGEVY